jgi:hypothetical protein
MLALTHEAETKPAADVYADNIAENQWIASKNCLFGHCHCRRQVSGGGLS